MSTKVSTGFGWLEDDVTGDPAGVRRHRDGKEFTIPLVETDPVTGMVEIFGPGGDPLIVIAAAAPSDADGRADGVVYIQTEA